MSPAALLFSDSSPSCGLLRQREGSCQLTKQPCEVSRHFFVTFLQNAEQTAPEAAEHKQEGANNEAALKKRL